MSVAVRILGPLEVEIDGVCARVGGAKRRALVALLAARSTTPLTLDTICDAVWADEPVEMARRSVHTYVSQLRRVVPVRLVPAGYQFDIAPSSVDAYRFEDLVQRAADVEPIEAGALLGEALALWRGPALAEFADAEWARRQATRWQELRLEAEDRWFAAERDAGREERVLPQLEAACADEPLRENRWELLMTALLRAGRPADALRAYGRARTALRDEMGVSPSPKLQQLELAILRHDPVAGARPAPATPLGTTSQSLSGNIRAPDHELIGREAELQRVRELLATQSLISLTGPGGVGKTRLATEIAYKNVSSFPDGAWLVDLATIGESDAVVSATLSALEVARLDALAERQMLVVLDNCEHVIDGAAALARALRKLSPGARILVTSRRRLGLSSEVVLLVTPLRVPHGAQTLRDLERTASFVMFSERAKSIDAPFTMTDSDAPAIVRCLAALGGLPLAIEIAASQLRSTSLLRLAVAVEKDAAGLELAWRDSPERHRTVASALRSSLQLLSASDRESFESLSVCRGFNVETAAAITLRSDIDACLIRLADASLITREHDDQYRMLEPVRQLAEQLLLARAPEHRYQERLADHILDSVRELGRRSYRDVVARSALRDEHGNVMLTLQHLIDIGRDTSAVTLFGSIGTYWFTENHAALEHWIPQITPRLDRQDRAIAAPARLALGMLREGTGDRAALPELRAARDGFLAAGRRRGAAIAAFWLARELAFASRDDVSVVRAFDEAFDLATEADDDITRNWCSIWLGILAREGNDALKATQHFRDAIRGSLLSGNHHPIGEAIGGLALLATQRGDLNSSRQLHDRAVTACRESGDDWQVTEQLLHRSRHYITTRYRLDRAAADLIECGQLVLRMGSQRGVVSTLSVAAFYLDACDEIPLARNTRATIAAWATERPGAAYGHIADTLADNPGDPVDDYLTAGLVPTPPAVQLRQVLDHLSAAHSPG
jgi:DNA-binding SARP family transcriptional activator/predicted ATPase